MNQSLEDIEAFCAEAQGWDDALACERWIAPQFVHMETLRAKAPPGLKVGAQNCSHRGEGALTGEVSPKALVEVGAHFVILGHSERRTLYGETDDIICAKVKVAQDVGLGVIFCVGENLEERQRGDTEAVIEGQLKRGLGGVNLEDGGLVVAYEPVWAIGTGKTATPKEAQAVHRFIRGALGQENLVILYGGSIKPSNARGLLSCPDIDGGLVGGASLKAQDFLAICKVAHELYTVG